jgi:hypothetical protein
VVSCGTGAAAVFVDCRAVVADAVARAGASCGVRAAVFAAVVRVVFTPLATVGASPPGWAFS